jgi:hypothetical protein
VKFSVNSLPVDSEGELLLAYIAGITYNNERYVFYGYPSINKNKFKKE